MLKPTVPTCKSMPDLPELTIARAGRSGTAKVRPVACMMSTMLCNHGPREENQNPQAVPGNYENPVLLTVPWDSLWIMVFWMHSAVDLLSTCFFYV